jgi:hypothetical protein
VLGRNHRLSRRIVSFFMPCLRHGLLALSLGQ